MEPQLNTNSIKAYVIGLAIGDGNLSNPNKRATRLRISCDPKYPKLIERIVKAIEVVIPGNKVAIAPQKTCVDISIYSNSLEDMLGWKDNQGSKFQQNVSIPEWIKQEHHYMINCLRGLIETDGCVYTDRGYRMVGFVTIIPRLAYDVLEIIECLGFKAKMYKIQPRNKAHQLTYRIRLSNKVEEFLRLVKVDKS
jgi:hypothetical protein